MITKNIIVLILSIVSILIITIIIVRNNFPKKLNKPIRQFTSGNNNNNKNSLSDYQLKTFLNAIPKCLHINTLSIDASVLIEYLQNTNLDSKLYIDESVLNEPVLDSNKLLFTLKNTGKQVTKDNLTDNIKDKIRNKFSSLNEVFPTNNNIYKQIENIKFQYYSLFSKINKIKVDIYKKLLENYINSLNYCSIVFYVDYLQFDDIATKEPNDDVTGIISLLRNIISDIDEDYNKKHYSNRITSCKFILELPRNLNIEDMKIKIQKIKEYNKLLENLQINIEGIVIVPTTNDNDISFYSEIWSDPQIFKDSNLKLYFDAGNYKVKNIENSNILQAIPFKPNIITNSQNIVKYPYIIKIIQNNNINIIDETQNIEEDIEDNNWWLYTWSNSYKDINLNICPVLDINTNYYTEQNINRYYGKLLVNTIPNNVIILSPLFTYFNSVDINYSLIDEYIKCYNIGIPLINIIYIILSTHRSVFGEDPLFLEKINTLLKSLEDSFLNLPSNIPNYYYRTDLPR